MARRRLAPADARRRADVPRAEHLPRDLLARLSPAAPIARVAAEAAGTAALEELTESVAPRARDGRMVLDLPLDAIAPDHLARDRLPVEDAEMAALAASHPRPRPAHADRGHALADGAGRPALRPHLRLAAARRR